MNGTLNRPAPAQPGTDVIHHSLLVSDINRDHPQCRPVFEKYGIAGCGGEYGPPEPLFIFAAAHRVPLPELVAELNAALRGEWRDESGKTKSPSGVEGRKADSGDPEATSAESAENLYKNFVFAALVVALTAGFTLGAVNLLRIAWAESYYVVGGALKQAHGHAQIFGWVGLLIMGVALHAVPRLKMQPLRPLWAARATLWLMTGGVLLRALAQPLARQPVWSLILVGSAMLELVAVGLFLWLIAGVVIRSEQPREFYEKFIYASLAWFLALAVANVWLVVQLAASGHVAIRALPNALWIQAGLFGFIANMIFAFSLRVLPHFLGLRESKVLPANAAVVLWNAAIFLRYPVERLAWAASVLELIAAVLFVYALGIFARRRTKIEIQGVDNSFGWFIRLGYAWLLVTATLPFHADLFRLSASARHAMALGFITPMILGVAYRVLPIFNGVNLWSNRLMRVSFWHYAAGSTLTIAMALNSTYGTPWTYAWSAAAGLLVLAALVMFGVNIALTLRGRAAKFTRQSAVTLQTRVAELLEVHPGLRPVLIHGGLAGLAAMKHNPPRFVTVEFAARRHGLDPQPLIAALNDAIRERER